MKRTHRFLRSVLGPLFALAALGLAARAEPAGPALREVHVAVLDYFSPEESSTLGESLRRELRARPERPALTYRVTVLNLPFTDEATASAVDKLKQMRADIILAGSPLLLPKILAATESVPVVASGQAFLWSMPQFASIARPGGRVTGFIRDPSGSLAKRVELLQSFCPAVKRVGNLLGVQSRTDQGILDFMAKENELLQTRGAMVIPIYLGPDELVSGLAEAIRANRLDALNVSLSTDVRDRLEEVSEKLQSLGIPHIYTQANVVERGGALGAQPAPFDFARTGAEYISRIAHGEPAGEIPVQVSRAFDIAVHTERIRHFHGCDPRRIAKIATRFYP